MAHLSHLTLTNFRNFMQLELDLNPGVCVFFGANAQGKTTLLEAVYLLAIARSFRAENEREVVNFGAALQGEPALVGGTVEKREERLSIYIGYQPQPVRGSSQSLVVPGSSKPEPQLKVDKRSNGEPPPAGRPLDSPATPRPNGLRGYSARKQIRVSRISRSAAELVGMVGAVLFSADDIDLVYGPPSGRRRYLNILISQSDPLYIKALQRYQRVVRQRNQLLKTLREGRAEAGELDFWDDELVREGAWLTWRRKEAMSHLSALGAEHYQRLGGADQRFQMEYSPSVPPAEDSLSTEERFRESLSAARQRESVLAATEVGPHRDDFALSINGLNMGTFASRGEARTAALTLRLAEASYISSVRGEEPIVLLDDVLSEMDISRRRRVLEKITVYEQVMITTTDPELIQQLLGPEAAYFRVEAGQIIALGHNPESAPYTPERAEE